MINYHSRPYTVICSLCSEEIAPGKPFYSDHFMDDEDGTACLPCVEEMDDHFAQEDGDFQRKLALEA